MLAVDSPVALALQEVVQVRLRVVHVQWLVIFHFVFVLVEILDFLIIVLMLWSLVFDIIFELLVLLRRLKLVVSKLLRRFYRFMSLFFLLLHLFLQLFKLFLSLFFLFLLLSLLGLCLFNVYFHARTKVVRKLNLISYDVVILSRFLQVVKEEVPLRELNMFIQRLSQAIANLLQI